MAFPLKQFMIIFQWATLQLEIIFHSCFILDHHHHMYNGIFLEENFMAYSMLMIVERDWHMSHFGMVTIIK
ncbi:hypothetical protein BLOT_013801 [Blomia tropicalis]|nr:hypothetical protein BLOT_013801 [Blomia tropicalis]